MNTMAIFAVLTLLRYDMVVILEKWRPAAPWSWRQNSSKKAGPYREQTGPGP